MDERTPAPALSIVVPFFDVEQYIEPCLRSLQRQTFADFEAILVDDGSRDGSVDVAERFCAEDDRFRLVRQENSGLGPARNTGVVHARGELLAFVDSDDLLPARTYERMIASLRATGSDFVCGNARRFNNLGVQDSWLHRRVFTSSASATHVRELPVLALDRMAWNKVYRRDFWDRHRLEYPPILYEDYPVTIRAHVLARAVDVLAGPVYYWRSREGGEPSITQQKWQLGNLRDRAVSADMVLDFLDEHAPELRDRVLRMFLQIDVSAMVAALRELAPGEQAEVLEMAARLVERADSSVLGAMDPFERVQNHLVAARRLPELVELVQYRASVGTTGPVVRKGLLRRRFCMALPFLGDRRVGVPLSAYEVPPHQVRVIASVTDIEWHEDEVRLELRAFMNLLPMEGAEIRLRVERLGEGSQPVVTLPVETFRVDRAAHPADPAGIRTRIRLDDLRQEGRLDPGFWQLRIDIAVGGTRDSRLVGRVASSRARWAAFRPVERGLSVRGGVAGGGFGLDLRRLEDVVTHVQAAGDVIEIEGRLGDAEPVDPAPVLQLRLADGSAATEVVAASSRGDHGHTFRVRVPVQQLIADVGQDPVEERTEWIVRLLVDGQPRRLAVGPTVRHDSVLAGERRVATRTSLHGMLLLHEGFAHPVVDDAQWVRPGLLELTGTHDRNDARPGHLELRRYLTPLHRVSVEMPVTWRGTRFVGRIDVEELTAAAGSVDTGDERPRAPEWVLLLPDGADGDRVTLDISRFEHMAGPWRRPQGSYRLSAGRSESFLLVKE